ncbi:MAG: tRNA (pseudouridine(54)-N(1))-methyltransferase TrmY [Candidatus Bipolaricaulota bacterium]|nr:tRNA (pseudouridine(54)-N(1))-methyltransferase TrmY [Candidatus Bipolaricaulota bacterium]MDW8030386.1 tRNA (pseudouridine(54)-N(1))-methyltransferase TrmY [Candidatus Bipolaricaulota bacterium]
MRAFIVLGHRVPLTPHFMLNDLPGSAGRLDILCRCVTAAFCLSHGIRRDVLVYLVLQDQLIVRLEGRRLKHLNPDERSTAALLQKALAAFAYRPHAGGELESTPGIWIASGGLSKALEHVQALGLTVYWLHEKGAPIRQAQLSADAAFVLSDHLEFLPEEAALLERFTSLSLGPLSLHADHCIVIAHNELDVRFASPGAFQ